jgi:hypothetical protein
MASRIEHKLVTIGGFSERINYPSTQKTQPSEKIEKGVVYFDRGQSGFWFRCYDAANTFETKLSDILKIVIVQNVPEQSAHGHSYLRIVRTEGKGKTVFIDILESIHGPNEYDALGGQLAELYGLPLEITPDYD